MELATRGVERVLLLFGDGGPDERSAFVVDELEKDSRDGFVQPSGLFLQSSDDLAAEHP